MVVVLATTPRFRPQLDARRVTLPSPWQPVSLNSMLGTQQAETALREGEAAYRAVVEGQTFILRWRPDAPVFVNE